MTAALLALLLATSPTTAAASAVVPAITNPEVPPQDNKPAPTPDDSNEPGTLIKDMAAGGPHWRLMTERGAVHIWRPAGFDQRTAGTLVYVHGFYTNVDQAWDDFRLAEQFRSSRRNALFVVPEAPVSGNERVRWETIEALLEVVASQAHVNVPAGPVVVMGHSGAFITILGWLKSPRMEQIILIDGLYNSEPDFAAWLGTTEKMHRMVLVGFETAERSEAFLPGFGEALYREGLPANPGQFRRSERQAKLLYVHSQYDHMGLVSGGKAIPVLLRLAPFRPL
jgi:hypothetical protein